MLAFLRRKARLRTLAGEMKLVTGTPSAEQESHSADAMMRIIRLISTEVSNPRLTFEGTGRTADFDCPYAIWICTEGRLGVTIRQDEDSRIRMTAMIHISARASDRVCSEVIVDLQRWLATSIYENRSKFGIEDIFWI